MKGGAKLVENIWVRGQNKTRHTPSLYLISSLLLAEWVAPRGLGLSGSSFGAAFHCFEIIVPLARTRGQCSGRTEASVIICYEVAIGLDLKVNKQIQQWKCRTNIVVCAIEVIGIFACERGIGAEENTARVIVVPKRKCSLIFRGTGKAAAAVVSVLEAKRCHCDVRGRSRSPTDKYRCMYECWEPCQYEEGNDGECEASHDSTQKVMECW